MDNVEHRRPARFRPGRFEVDAAKPKRADDRIKVKRSKKRREPGLIKGLY